jgi:hypothetical protein
MATWRSIAPASSSASVRSPATAPYAAGIAGVPVSKRRAVTGKSSVRGSKENGLTRPNQPVSSRWHVVLQPAACVEEGHPWHAEQVLQRACHEVVAVQFVNVDREHAGRLVGIHEHPRASGVGRVGDLPDREPHTAAVRDGGDRDQAGLLADDRGVVTCAGFIVGDETHRRAAAALRQPHVRDRGELQVRGDNDWPVLPAESGRHLVGPLGRAAHDRDLVRRRADEGGEQAPRRIDLRHPPVPRRAVGAQRPLEFLQRRDQPQRRGALAAAGQVNGVGQGRELATEPLRGHPIKQTTDRLGA